MPVHNDNCKTHANYRTISGNKLDVAVAYPTKFGSDFLSIPELPQKRTNKHLSYRTHPVLYKQIKKVSTVRHFYRPNSVFAEFTEPTRRVLDLGFELDKQFLKNYKFIKNQQDLEKTASVLKQYFPKLMV